MSLIDLPGMTRIPVKGQPDDIADRLERLIMSYIRNPSCIILAVSAANTDLANSDAIAMSRAVDPEGLRTIGAHLFSPTHSPLAISAPISPNTGTWKPPTNCCSMVLRLYSLRLSTTGQLQPARRSSRTRGPACTTRCCSGKRSQVTPYDCH